MNYRLICGTLSVKKMDEEGGMHGENLVKQQSEPRLINMQRK